MNDYHFVPIVVETFGTFGTTGLNFLKEIGSNIVLETGEKRATSYLLQNISMAIQRGNAHSVLGTSLDSNNYLDEVFFL